jgi:hypothetical protein
MFGSGYENCPEFGVLVVLFLSLIFCKQKEKLLFFGSVSGCTCLILTGRSSRLLRIRFSADHVLVYGVSFPVYET